MSGTEAQIDDRLGADAARQTFLNNMAALWARDPELAQQLDELPDSALLPIATARSGVPTLAVKGSKGKLIWLHSRYDPQREARLLAETVEPETSCVILTGLGLGHVAKAILQRTARRSLLVVLEPDLRMIFTALHCTDLAEEIRSGRLVFLTRDEPAHIHSHLEPHNLTIMAGTQIVTHQPSLQIAEDFHARMTRRIAEFAAFCRMSLATLVTNAQVTCQNIAYNLPTYLATPPIDHLKNRFAGLPGIVVSAGPSLRKNLDLLAQAKGRAVICCVQTVFKTLLAKDITPDFVTSLDYHEVSRRFFEGIDDFKGVHLVAEPKATWHVIDAYKGPISLLNNPFARLCLDDDLAARDGLRAGATVAHLAFYLLEYMGCDPIILIGQDLAFSDGLYYAPGVSVHEVWQAEVNRYNTLEMLEWLRIARHKKILHRAADIHGRPVYTDEQMLTYLKQFERDFARSSAKIIDATEGGLPKRGAETMTLAEAMERFCTRQIPQEAFAYRKRLNWWDGGKLPLGRTRIVEKLRRLDDFVQLCRRTKKEINALKNLLDRPAEFNRRIARVDQARALVRKDFTILKMVTDLAQLAEFRKINADRQIEAEGLTGRDKAERQLQRDA